MGTNRYHFSVQLSSGGLLGWGLRLKVGLRVVGFQFQGNVSATYSSEG
jgi:hypothetical protein